ncbi:MAG TPA: hypothetical protein VFZ01_10710 [Geminicoccaceae bacterium]
MYRALYAYAWDLLDEGLDAALPAIRGTAVNTITLATSYHAGKFLRPHGRSGKVHFPKDGTVYFRPEMGRYGRIRPLVNPLVDEFDALAELARVAPDLDRVAWTVCLHNTALGEAHPDVVTRNAFGDPYWYSLSPAHPDARAYVVALCGDLGARYEISGLVLETPGWLPYDHGFHHEFAMVPLDRFHKTLLALDFSDAAVAAARGAGIDAAGLRRRVRDRLERFLGSDVALPEARADEWLLADLLGDPELAAFLRWRCEVVAGLIREVRAALPPHVRLAVIPTVNRPTAACWLEGSDLAMLAQAADALEVPTYEADAGGVLLDALDVRRRAGEGADLRFILRPSFPDLGNGTGLEAAVRHLKAVGPSGLAFYNYGHLRRASLDRIAGALALLEDPS